MIHGPTIFGPWGAATRFARAWIRHIARDIELKGLSLLVALMLYGPTGYK